MKKIRINLLVFVFPDAMTDLDIQELATLTAGDADVDNFERLFTKLKQMKGIFKKLERAKKESGEADISFTSQKKLLQCLVSRGKFMQKRYQ